MTTIKDTFHFQGGENWQNWGRSFYQMFTEKKKYLNSHKRLPYLENHIFK